MQNNNEFRSVSKSMMLVMVFMMLSKIMGFVREVALSAKFGMDWVTDAYKAAFDIPCLLLAVLASAVAAVFIPVYNNRLKEGEKAASRFVSNLYAVGLTASTVIALVTMLLLRHLVPMILPDADAQTQALTIRLAQIMMPMALFTFLHRLTSAYLQARFQFAAPAAAPLFGNLCIVVGIVLSGGNIYIVALFALLGTVAQFLVQMPKARGIGLRVKPVFDLREPGTLEVLRLMAPVLIASAFDQLYIVFDRAVTSGVAGDISALDYGNRISTMVSSVLLVSIATVLYPNLVRYAKDSKRYAEHFSLGVNLNLLIAIPAMAALLILRVPVTRLVYERGEFIPEHTLVTSKTLGCYALGILGVGLRDLCNRSFFALNDMKSPTIVGVGVVVLDVTLNYTLYHFMGVSGVALATAVGACVGTAALLMLLRKKIPSLGGKRILTCLWKTLAASAALCAVLAIGAARLSLTTLSGKGLLLNLGGLSAAALLTYLAVLWALRTEELRLLTGLLKRRAATRGPANLS